MQVAGTTSGHPHASFGRDVAVGTLVGGAALGAASMVFGHVPANLALEWAGFGAILGGATGAASHVGLLGEPGVPRRAVTAAVTGLALPAAVYGLSMLMPPGPIQFVTRGLAGGLAVATASAALAVSVTH